jgi:hypothetical protein
MISIGYQILQRHRHIGTTAKRRWAESGFGEEPKLTILPFWVFLVQCIQGIATDVTRGACAITRSTCGIWVVGMRWPHT